MTTLVCYKADISSSCKAVVRTILDEKRKDENPSEEMYNGGEKNREACKASLFSGVYFEQFANFNLGFIYICIYEREKKEEHVRDVTRPFCGIAHFGWSVHAPFSAQLGFHGYLKGPQGER